MSGKARIAVVVPAFNEGSVLANVVRQVQPACTWCIVVDDGSTDDTNAVARASGALVLRHVVNRGAGAATLTGIRFALRLGADVIVSFDADGQHDPADIPALVAPVLAGEADLALGSRFLGRTEGMPLSRALLLKGGILFTRLFSGIHVTDTHNGLRAWSRDAAQALEITMDRMAHASEILDQIRPRGWRFREVPVTVRYSGYSMAKGQSSWNSIRIAVELLLRRLGA